MIGVMGGFASVRIIEDANMVDFICDWSEVRSPSRARRRLKLGHRQRIKQIKVPKETAYVMHGGRTLVMHPEMAAALRRMTK